MIYVEIYVEKLRQAPQNITTMTPIVTACMLFTATTAFVSKPPCSSKDSILYLGMNQNDIVPAPAEKMTASASIPRVLSRADGQELMDNVILPSNAYGNRIEVGRDAQGLRAGSGVPVNPQDARMFLTYGEFPLHSLDELLDLALPYVANPQSISMIDVGSGCGRLALYAALTRGSPQQSWNVHGIEISPILHHEAVQALSRAMNGGHAVDYQPQPGNNSCCNLFLHAGAAQEWKQVFATGHVVFAYSTAWETNGFSEEMGAMVIGREWSGLLSESCPNGSVAITTDRALDPAYGWQLVDRLNVDNREVMGSTGYIHVLKR